MKISFFLSKVNFTIYKKNRSSLGIIIEKLKVERKGNIRYFYNKKILVGSLRVIMLLRKIFYKI